MIPTSMHVLVGHGVSTGNVFQCCMLARRVRSNGSNIAFLFLVRVSPFHVRLLVTLLMSAYVLDELGFVPLTWTVSSWFLHDIFATPTLHLGNRSHPPPLGGNTMACHPCCVVQRRHLPRKEGLCLRSQSSSVYPSHPDLHIRSMHRFLLSSIGFVSTCIHVVLSPCTTLHGALALLVPSHSYMDGTNPRPIDNHGQPCHANPSEYSPPPLGDVRRRNVRARVARASTWRLFDAHVGNEGRWEVESVAGSPTRRT